MTTSKIRWVLSPSPPKRPSAPFMTCWSKLCTQHMFYFSSHVIYFRCCKHYVGFDCLARCRETTTAAEQRHLSEKLAIELAFRSSKYRHTRNHRQRAQYQLFLCVCSLMFFFSYQCCARAHSLATTAIGNTYRSFKSVLTST